MPLVTALHAWLAMVPAIALVPDTRLEIVIQNGWLDVIEMKKLEKVGQIPTSEQYQLKLAKVLAHYIRTVPFGRTFLFYKATCPNLSARDNLYSLPMLYFSPACEPRCLVVGILDTP